VYRRPTVLRRHIHEKINVFTLVSQLAFNYNLLI